MSPSANRPRPIVLVIMDGFGERAETADNAVRLARTPNISSIRATYPQTLIGTSGADVGLPPGQMGNSEVGHLNFGAGQGRDDGHLANRQRRPRRNAREEPGHRKSSPRQRPTRGRIHLLGLVSDGGVHSSLGHLKALIAWRRLLACPSSCTRSSTGATCSPGLRRDTLRRWRARSPVASADIATVSGRYWGMDRDNRWERVERSFRAIVEATAPRAPSAGAGIEQSYAAGKTDEFVEPFVVGDYEGRSAPATRRSISTSVPTARANSRGRSPSRRSTLLRAPGAGTIRQSLRLHDDLRQHATGCPIAFPKETHVNIFPEVIAHAGLKQFRCAETEKYAHVTYFFNGGREEPFEGEDRKMSPSPKDVATYDLQARR